MEDRQIDDRNTKTLLRASGEKKEKEKGKERKGENEKGNKGGNIERGKRTK